LSGALGDGVAKGVGPPEGGVSGTKPTGFPQANSGSLGTAKMLWMYIGKKRFIFVIKNKYMKPTIQYKTIPSRF